MVGQTLHIYDIGDGGVYRIARLVGYKDHV
jgi:hypothetical protein